MDLVCQLNPLGTAGGPRVPGALVAQDYGPRVPAQYAWHSRRTLVCQAPTGLRSWWHRTTDLVCQLHPHGTADCGRRVPLWHSKRTLEIISSQIEHAGSIMFERFSAAARREEAFGAAARHQKLQKYRTVPNIVRVGPSALRPLSLGDPLAQRHSGTASKKTIASGAEIVAAT